MYSISDYGAMIADSARIDAHVRALRRVITPDTVVVDIGAGTGILALLACQLGARRVFAIEPNDAIHVAREAAASNGYGDRIECIQALSTAVTLPERADVIVSDIGGVLPWLQHHLPSIMDARARLLAPGGTLIPQRDTLWIALVDSEDAYRRSAEPWDSRPYGLDLTSSRRLAMSIWKQARVTAEQLLMPVQRVLSLDYLTLSDTDLTAAVEWGIDRVCTAHGLAAGIERILVDGVGFSNAPDSPAPLPPESIYRSAFFPWPSPVALQPGDVVTSEIRAVLVGDDYIWSWDTRVRDALSCVKAQFEQSTFHGIPLSPAQVRKRSASHVPVLNEDGSATSLALDLMRRSMAVGEIAEELTRRFPLRFPDRPGALAFAADLSQRYSE